MKILISALLSCASAFAQTTALPTECQSDLENYSSNASRLIRLLQRTSAADARHQRVSFDLNFVGGLRWAQPNGDMQALAISRFSEPAFPVTFRELLQLRDERLWAHFDELVAEETALQSARRAPRRRLRAIAEEIQAIVARFNPVGRDGATAIERLSSSIARDLSEIETACGGATSATPLLRQAAQACPNRTVRTYQMTEIYTGPATEIVSSRHFNISVCQRRTLDLERTTASGSAFSVFRAPVVLQTCTRYDLRTYASTDVIPADVGLVFGNTTVPLTTAALALTQSDSTCQAAYIESL